MSQEFEPDTTTNITKETSLKNIEEQGCDELEDSQNQNHKVINDSNDKAGNAIPPISKWKSYMALFVYTLLNIYTYFSRYIPSILKDFIAEDMGLTDVQTGFLFTAFIICYMVVSPVVGFLIDRQLIPRRLVAICGVLLFSLATAAAGFCKSYGLLVTARVFFGMGEAAYVTVSAPILCDYFPPHQRNLVMGIFLGATPIGCALGYLIAGTVGGIIGWRKTFVVLAIPGIFAFVLLLLKEPKVGAFDVKEENEENEESEDKNNDDDVTDDVMDDVRNRGFINDKVVITVEKEEEGEREREEEEGANDDDNDDNCDATDSLIKRKSEPQSKGKMIIESIKEKAKVLCNGPYIVAVGGYIADTFGMGGFSDWLPTFFVRYYGLSVWEAGLTNGAIIVVCGCLGTLAGSFLADSTKAHVTRRHPYLLVSGVSMLLCSIICVLGLYLFTSSKIYIEAMLSLGMLLGWFSNGPINAIILNSVPPSHRSSANGLAVLLIHLLGDAISPSIIGLISDCTNSNLRISLLLIPMSLFISGFVWIGGWAILPKKYINSKILT